MGILERQWLLDNEELLLLEMEYYRVNKGAFSGSRQQLCYVPDGEGRLKIETTK